MAKHIAGVPRDDADIWADGVAWVQAAMMQAARFEEALGEWVHAGSDARERDQLNGEDLDESRRSWRAHYDAMPAYDPQRPLRVPSWSLNMQVGHELAFLLVAVRNVLRVEARIPEDERQPMTDSQLLTFLRDASEHWDEVGGKAAEGLAAGYPFAVDGGVAATGKEIWIGGLKDDGTPGGVPLSRVRAWLARVWLDLAARSAAAGHPLPDDLSASQVEGDDALSWPKERLRFGWWLGVPDEADWPREPAPPAVVDLLAERFAHQRARDPHD